MTGRLFLFPVLILLIATTCTLSGAMPDDESSDYRPGEEGHALTVIAGGDIVSIPVRFMGIVRGALGPGIDLFLVELQGPIAAEAGVANGMSGSPVYFRDKLLGALAYRLGDIPKRAIGGVVPFTHMKDAALASVPAVVNGDEPISPIGTPVVMSGVDSPVREWLVPRLLEVGLVSTVGGGADRKAPARALRPGSHVGVELVGGDMHLAATGTVTEVEGDRVYAFGHSFMGQGSVEFPMVSAEVVHMLQDMLGSVMLSNTGPVIGAVLDDRRTAMIGYLGRRAETIPVDVTLRGFRFGERTLHYDVVRHSSLTPMLIGAAVANGILNSVGFESEVTVRASGRIVMKGEMELPVEMAFTAGPGGDPLISAASRIQGRVGAVYGNRFETPEIKAIEITMDVRQGRRSYRLERLLYDREKVKAGEEIVAHCVMSSYRSEELREEIRVRIPEGVAPGTRLALVVGGADDVEVALGRPLAGRTASAGDLRTYLEVLSETRPSNTLRAVLLRADDGAVVAGGASLDGLPPSASELLGSGKGNGAGRTVRVSPLSGYEREMDGPVRGRRSALITVGRTAVGGSGR